MSPSSSRPTARSIALAGLSAYVVFVAWVLLRSSSTLGFGVALKVWEIAVWFGAPPTWQNVVRAEFVANIGMFVPLTLLAAIIWTRPTWRDWTAYAFVLSFAAELVQGLLLPGRSATYSDVVANTLGALIGAVVGRLLVRLRGFDTSSPGGSDGSTSWSDGFDTSSPGGSDGSTS